MSQSVARSVLAAEIAGLKTLVDALDDAFDAAVAALLSARGHVIVTGVGKSGHIGAKIASTLASTGTPAFFMHPAEASHGDLGMISDGVIVLALSNSGESRELRDVALYTRSRGVGLIAMTQAAGSSLAQQADIVLSIPKSPEADTNGLAPTTSTTCMLALGDALALSVMEARGFTREDFSARHPGGRLGLQLQRVGDWLASQSGPLPLVPETADMSTIINEIASGQMGCTGVINASGELSGMITDGDLRRALAAKQLDGTALEIMTDDPTTLSPDMRLGDVIDLFTDKRISNAFVIEHNRPIGAVHMKDLLGAGYV